MIPNSFLAVYESLSHDVKGSVSQKLALQTLFLEDQIKSKKAFHTLSWDDLRGSLLLDAARGRAWSLLPCCTEKKN